MASVCVCDSWICYMAHWYLWHDSLMYVIWLIDMCVMFYLQRVEHQPRYLHGVCVCVCATLGYVTWRIDICDMTHWSMWHDSLICVMWLILKKWNTSRAIYMASVCVRVWHMDIWHDALIHVTWLADICDALLHWYIGQLIPREVNTSRAISRRVCVCDSYMCDMTPGYMWHDSLIYVTWLIPREWNTSRAIYTASVCVCVTWRIDICDMAHWHMWRDSFVGSGTPAALFLWRLGLSCSCYWCKMLWCVQLYM